MLNNYSAAECCARGPRCSGKAARTSGGCKTGRWMSQQSRKCKKHACLYCYQKGRRTNVPVCRMHAISKNCFRGKKPPAARPGRSSGRGRGKGKGKGRGRKRSGRKNRRRSGSGSRNNQRSAPRAGCAYRGTSGNKIVIPSTGLSAGNGWTKEAGAIIYRKGDPQGSVDAEGSGTMCVKVMFPSPGKYYFTALTKAPHPTEHNDMWVRISSGFDLVHTSKGAFKSGGSSWYKGYQNRGGMQMADYLLTIDNDGHQFQTKNVAAGPAYSLCISGRSTKFWVYKLVLIKCDGDNCNRNSPFIRSKMNGLPNSPCK
ncbi:unnamed protein product [Chondrus crispus]|uniref:Uncharacterized protein n=1 Tax=Chondrus crispus TaxID=2769 RepID=R7QCY0_CHOCR|nr:unnamed protein product [Chondrus crispus]CDF36362.1 unnamed protein product [Chondrus crispus]|eukprot:XP_005716181.1 unnamed protein product [Chondrus crispus]